MIGVAPHFDFHVTYSILVFHDLRPLWILKASALHLRPTLRRTPPGVALVAGARAILVYQARHLADSPATSVLSLRG